VHFNLWNWADVLRSDVQGVDPCLQLGLELRLQMVSCLLNLDGDEIARFRLKASLDLLANLLALSFFDKGNFVVLLDQIEFLFQFLLGNLLL
jgi:hypothetical protein